MSGVTLPSAAKTIRYTGSKRKILPKIQLITKDLVFNNVLDAFSGSGIVSLFFKMQGKTVHSNDLAVYSKCIAETFLLSREDKDSIQEEIDYLNSLAPVEGWYSENYGGKSTEGGLSIQDDGLKKPFYIETARKLDAIREEIDKLYPCLPILSSVPPTGVRASLRDLRSPSIEDITRDQCQIRRSILLTSLLIGLDSRCNDMGHQVSYLRKWSPKALRPLHLKIPF